MRRCAVVVFVVVAVMAFGVAAFAMEGLKPKPGFGLSTADTRIGLNVIDGQPVITSLSAGKSKSWTGNWPETALPQIYTVNGEDKPLKWKAKGNMHLFTHGGTLTLSTNYECADPQLSLVSYWFIHNVEQPGPIEHTVRIENKGKDAVTLLPPPTLALGMLPRTGLQNWWIEKTSGHVGDPGTHTDTMQAGYQKVLDCGPYSLSEAKRDELPWFCIQDTASKQGIYGGIEFSGWTQTKVEMDQAGQVNISMGLTPRGENKARSRIEPGATLTLPTCFIGAYKGDVDDGCNDLHRFIEAYLRPKMPYGVTPWLVNNSWGSGMVVDEALAKSMIDQSADLGIEIFHVDAGWYKNVGDWHSSPTKFPNGLEKTADYAHSKGLKFGLWVGWTQGGSVKTDSMESLNVFNPVQKNWFGGDLPIDWHNWDFTGATVCLACKDAKEWCLNDLRRMIKQYKLDLLEHDQVMVLDSCGRENHGHVPGDRMDVSRACAEAYYSIYDQLHKENPNLLFENCVNGGRFFDFGVAKRTNYMCMTDDYDPLNLRKCFYDASYPFPPSMLEAYISDHRGATLANFRYMLRSAMLGWCTIMMDMGKWTPEQRTAGKNEFTCYKERLRPLIASANVYHVLPRPDGKQWDGMQYVNPKTGKGVLFVFRPQSDTESQAVVFKGLNPKKSYAVAALDGSSSGTYTGAELMKTGLTVKLAEKNSSDLVFFSAVK